jgi:hypothetical protein
MALNVVRYYRFLPCYSQLHAVECAVFSRISIPEHQSLSGFHIARLSSTQLAAELDCKPVVSLSCDVKPA